MKTIIARGTYAVSFNCAFGGDFICGDESMYTLDYAGDDIDALAAEVIASDPKYPMAFVRNPDANSNIIGHFHHVDNAAACDAVMVVYKLLAVD